MKSRSFQAFVAVLLLVVCMPVLTGCNGGSCCCLYLWGGVAAITAAVAGGGTDIIGAICNIVPIPGLCDQAQ